MATITYSLDTLVDEFVVNTTTEDDQRDPDVVILDDGSMFFSFTTDGPNFEDVFFRRFAADGTRLDVNDRPLASSSNDDDSSEAAVLSNGNIVVAYAEADHVEFEIRTPAGGGVIDGQTVPSLGNANSSSPDVAALADGGFVVTYHEPFPGDPENTNVNFVVYNTDGTLRAGPHVAAGNSTSLGTIHGRVTALENGNFVVAWAEEVSGEALDVDVKARIFDANGTAVGSEVTITNQIGIQAQPAMAALPGGGFALVLTDGDGNELELGIYDAAGVRVGNQGVIDGVGGEFLSEPSITVVSDTLLLVSYTSNRADGGNVFAQLFDFNGNKVGDEFVIEQALDRQDNSTVASRGDGRVVATWDDGVPAVGADNSGSHVGAQGDGAHAHHRQRRHRRDARRRQSPRRHQRQ